MATTEDIAMQVTGVAEKLAAHERIQEDRYEHLKSGQEHLEKGIAEIKSAESAETEAKMSTVNVESPMGGMAGVLPLLMGGGNGWNNNSGGALGGASGGAIGAFLGSALGNRRGGLLGGDGDVGGNFVTPTQLTSAINGVIDNNNATTNLQTLGDIKTAVAGVNASVALAEGQGQLSMQNAQADINRNIDNTGDQITAQISAAQLNNANNFAAQARQTSDILAASIANQNSIRSDLNIGVASINAGIANLATASLQQTYALNTAIRDASDKAVAATTAQGLETRALINSLNTHNLERTLSEANNKINMLELAAQNTGTQRQLRETEINISNTNTATAQQMQAQTMQQQQFQILAQLGAAVGNLANDMQTIRQTQSNVNFGVQGNAGQNASAANNRVN